MIKLHKHKHNLIQPSKEMIKREYLWNKTVKQTVRSEVWLTWFELGETFRTLRDSQQ